MAAAANSAKQASDLERPARVAGAYSAALPESRAVAIETTLRLYAANEAQVEAVERMLASVGPVKSLGRFRVLRCVHFAPEGRRTQAEIMNELRVTSANVTRLVDALETSGLVKRRPHPTDRRVTFVELTAEGKAAANSMAEAMAEFMKVICRGFSDEELAVLSALLLRLQKNAMASYVTPAGS